MKQLVCYLLLWTAIAPGCFGQTWKSDPDHSRLGFATTHMLISEVRGIFRTFEINLKAKKSDFSDAVIELTADINSIDTEVEDRDKHLKSPDFFDAENYPTMKFKSTSINETGKNRYRVTGDLTIHNITKQVSIKMVYNGTILNNNTNMSTAGFQATGEINRLDFNIGTKFPANVISEAVTIIIDAEMQLQ